MRSQWGAPARASAGIAVGEHGILAHDPVAQRGAVAAVAGQADAQGAGGVAKRVRRAVQHGSVLAGDGERGELGSAGARAFGLPPFQSALERGVVMRIVAAPLARFVQPAGVERAQAILGGGVERHAGQRGGSNTLPSADGSS